MDMLEIIKELESKPDKERKEIIIRRLKSMKVPFEIHRYTFTDCLNKRCGENIIVPGKDSLPEIGIASHYDAVPGSPGADDNASAVAVTLDLIEKIKANPLQNIGARYFFFDQEEIKLTGSRAYIQQKGAGNMFGLYNMEMVGLGDIIAAWDVTTGGRLVYTLEETARKLKIPCVRLPEVVGHDADHRSFRGIFGQDALTITTIPQEDIMLYGQFLAESAQKTKLEKEDLWKGFALKTRKLRHYHNSTDASVNINPQTLHNVSEILYACLKSIDLHKN